MITIINVTPNLSPFGWHEYEVRINQQVITRFLHRRQDGLATCLQLAAHSVEMAKWKGGIEALVNEEQKEGR